MDMAGNAPATMVSGATEILRPVDQRYRRERPKDFKTFSAGKSRHELSKHYGANHRTVRRWLEEIGAKSREYVRRGLPAPGDLADRAATTHLMALARHYGVSQSVVSRWLSEAELTAAKPPVSGHAASPVIPAGFAETVRGLNKSQIRERYSVSHSTIDRWIKATGAQVLVGRAMWGASKPSGPPPVSGDLASQAAQHLRRFCASVYPCSILTKHERDQLPGKGAGLWYVAGKRHITAEEMIAFAETKGFDRGAWARI